MTTQDFLQSIDNLLGNAQTVVANPSRADLIQASLDNRECIVTESGALTKWGPAHSTGRSPADTYVVQHPESSATIDWTSKANNPLPPEVFDEVFNDAIQSLNAKERIYLTNRVVGADSNYAMPCRLICDRALHALFSDNMFRPIPDDISNSIFADLEFTILALPYDRLDRNKYEGKLRKNGDKTSDMIIVMDMDRRIGIVYGSSYCGSVKKMMFTVMNYHLPAHDILPLHCSANEGEAGDIALFLGLSGTGKTTLSTDPTRKLLGDDEHGWAESGVANFENGCYAKLINLDPKKEPEIYDIVTEKKEVMENGVIIENAMVYPNGSIDFYDDRLTANSRTSYPLSLWENAKQSSTGGHPKTIIFLTADAYGVLPPVAKLNKEQAMLWFIMGYTSKLAGTETGVTEPQATFSRFFGEPFMPRNPHDYAELLGHMMEKHEANVYLINTGWSGGSYGVGKRMDIDWTRSIIEAALNGDLEKVSYQEDSRFHVMIPDSCPGVDDSILQPKNTWTDKEKFEETADMLATKFSEHFDKAYGHSEIKAEVVAMCPGK